MNRYIKYFKDTKYMNHLVNDKELIIKKIQWNIR